MDYLRWTIDSHQRAQVHLHRYHLCNLKFGKQVANEKQPAVINSKFIYTSHHGTASISGCPAFLVLRYGSAVSQRELKPSLSTAHHHGLP